FQNKKNTFLIACSGGMDSCVLAHLFNKKKIPFALAHVNYHLRGKESIRDEEFVRSLAKKYNVRLYLFDASVLLKKLQKKHSLQEAARIIRYNWLNEVLQAHGYHFLVTAHHANDQVETMLLNLFRGTGVRGMAGMKMKNNLHLRPLLHTTRHEINAYATKYRIAYRTDKSNFSDAYDRNYIRLHVMPILEKRWPHIVERLCKNAENLRLDIDLSNELIGQEIKKNSSEKKGHTQIQFKKLLRYSSPQTLLFVMLSPHGFNAKQCANMVTKASSAETKVFSSSTHTLSVKNNIGFLEKSEGHNSPPASIIITRKTTVLKTPLALSFTYPKKKVVSKNPLQACIDLSQVEFPLELRPWKPGDFFIPFGMKGKKKVSDLLTDLKYRAADKKNVFVLCDRHKIIWVAGIRLDDRVKITNKTSNCLLITLKP
ncbi:MAG: tRNA lysidine(34) synthetase TilS, partial [Flavobacteriales bacterium]